MTAEELLAANNICLSDTKPGRHYAICPRCSHTRSKTHQSAKCLGVTIDEKSVRFFCNHCDYAGGGYFNRNANGPAHSTPFVAVYDYAAAESTASLSLGIAQRVCRLAPARRWRDMPPEADISDWLAAGHTREELDALIDSAPAYGTAGAQPPSSSPWDDPDLSILDDR